MKKKMRFLSLLLAAALILGALPGTAFAAEDSDSSAPRDTYAENVVETVSIDETQYTIEYYYDEDENKTTEFYNNVQGTTDVLVFDESEGIFYLNGEQLATFSCLDTPNGANHLTRSGWEYLDSYSGEINDLLGVSIQIIAGIICNFVLSGTVGDIISLVGEPLL